MLKLNIYTLNVLFNNELVVINRKLGEFYLVNNIELRFYGLTQFSYYRIRNERTIIINGSQ